MNFDFDREIVPTMVYITFFLLFVIGICLICKRIRRRKKQEISQELESIAQLRYSPSLCKNTTPVPSPITTPIPTSKPDSKQIISITAPPITNTPTKQIEECDTKIKYTGEFRNRRDCPGNEIKEVLASFEGCKEKCNIDTNCKGFSHNHALLRKAENTASGWDVDKCILRTKSCKNSKVSSDEYDRDNLIQGWSFYTKEETTDCHTITVSQQPQTIKGASCITRSDLQSCTDGTLDPSGNTCQWFGIENQEICRVYSESTSLSSHLPPGIRHQFDDAINQASGISNPTITSSDTTERNPQTNGGNQIITLKSTSRENSQTTGGNPTTTFKASRSITTSRDTTGKNSESASKAQGTPPTTKAQGAQPTTKAQGAQPTTKAQGAPPTTKVQGAPPTTKVQGAPPTTKVQGVSSQENLQKHYDSQSGTHIISIFNPTTNNIEAGNYEEGSMKNKKIPFINIEALDKKFNNEKNERVTVLMGFHRGLDSSNMIQWWDSLQFLYKSDRMPYAKKFLENNNNRLFCFWVSFNINGSDRIMATEIDVAFVVKLAEQAGSYLSKQTPESAPDQENFFIKERTFNPTNNGNVRSEKIKDYLMEISIKMYPKVSDADKFLYLWWGHGSSNYSPMIGGKLLKTDSVIWLEDLVKKRGGRKLDILDTSQSCSDARPNILAFQSKFFKHILGSSLLRGNPSPSHCKPSEWNIGTVEPLTPFYYFYSNPKFIFINRDQDFCKNYIKLQMSTFLVYGTRLYFNKENCSIKNENIHYINGTELENYTVNFNDVKNTWLKKNTSASISKPYRQKAIEFIKDTAITVTWNSKTQTPMTELINLYNE